MSRYEVHIDNAFCVKVTNLKDCAGAAVTDAVLLFTLKSMDGTSIGGATAVPMPYSSGTYSGSATPSTPLTEGTYELTIYSANYGISWTQGVRAVVRAFGR